VSGNKQNNFSLTTVAEPELFCAIDIEELVREDMEKYKKV